MTITDGSLSVGDSIHIKGHTSDFIQRVDSIQIENEAVEVARPGDEVGVRVTETVREHDEVFRVTPD